MLGTRCLILLILVLGGGVSYIPGGIMLGAAGQVDAIFDLNFYIYRIFLFIHCVILDNALYFHF